MNSRELDEEWQESWVRFQRIRWCVITIVGIVATVLVPLIFVGIGSLLWAAVFFLFFMLVLISCLYSWKKDKERGYKIW